MPFTDFRTIKDVKSGRNDDGTLRPVLQGTKFEVGGVGSGSEIDVVKHAEGMVRVTLKIGGPEGMPLTFWIDMAAAQDIRDDLGLILRT